MVSKLKTTCELKPNTLIGVGLRHSHYQEALFKNTHKGIVDFVEVHAENFFAGGGASIALLNQVAQQFELSIHGTSLGLGSQQSLPESVLNKFAALINDFQPKLVSEHLCFNRALVDGQIMHSGDLLPISYDTASLNNIVSQISRVQDKIKRPILIEN